MLISDHEDQEVEAIHGETEQIPEGEGKSTQSKWEIRTTSWKQEEKEKVVG